LNTEFSFDVNESNTILARKKLFQTHLHKPKIITQRPASCKAKLRRIAGVLVETPAPDAWFDNPPHGDEPDTKKADNYPCSEETIPFSCQSSTQIAGRHND